MKEQFVTYEIALALKELGYNEPDFGYYRLSLEEEELPYEKTELMFFKERYDNNNHRLKLHPQTKIDNPICTAPLWQQAIDWLFINYDTIVTRDFVGYKVIQDKMHCITYSNSELPYTREVAILKAIELCQKKN